MITILLIHGLLPNTTYTCCVLAVTSYEESEPVCQNIITVNDKSELYDIIKYCVPPLSGNDSNCTSNTPSLTNTISWVTGLFMDIVNCTLIMLIMLILIVIMKGKS